MRKTHLLNTIRAAMREGHIQLLEKIEIPEGTEVLVTPLLDETAFWLQASQSTRDPIWENEADDVYAELLA